MNLGKVCLYVLERSMNKIIVGEKVLKKYKLRPAYVLMGRCKNVDLEINAFEENLKGKCLKEWEDLYKCELNKKVERNKYRKLFSEYLKNNNNCFDGVRVGEIRDNLYKLEDLEKVGEQYFVVWKQPRNNRYMISDVLKLNLKVVGEYDVVLADPAWGDGVSSNPTRGLSITYPTIKVDQIERIPVDKLCPG
eukprot:snap_masked-scaffold_1-processed-gene-23.38-mRNA-1 protein AED:1.00 eAED:1.00 QI:0/-1/0/0/-1/1/1/0/191